ncbi:MAG: T9SS type A sorting domain-containing protein [Phaeodactylibacter sp.]|nr:T9SS type A sorting domain-containing protein [Phaeodactylibacter sp.]
MKIQFTNLTPLTNSFFQRSFTLLLAALLLIGGQARLSAQTCTGYFTLTTQSQIDAFGPCTTITGWLRIQDDGTDPITNLDALSNLASVEGELRIMHNGQLTNLDGLSNLASLEGNLAIYNNAQLDNLDGLSALTSVGEQLVIYNNSQLSNLTGLSALASVGEQLNISYNGQLTNLTGLSNLAGVGGSMTISHNAQLTSLTGLSNLASIGSYLNIQNNPQLNDLTALSNLASLGEDLSIQNNAQLSNLTGLSGLTSITEDLEIKSNAQLTSLTGLSNLASVGGDVVIENNNQLPNLEGLSALVSVAERISIHNNAQLTNLDGLSALANVTWNLEIYNNPLLSECCALNTVLNGGTLNGRIEMYGNTGNCNANGADITPTACGPDVCINAEVSNLNAYVDGLSISSSMKRTITRRLDLAASRFCGGYSTSSVINSLDYVVSYVQYQSGSGIPVDAAGHIIAQVNGLIDALNAGVLVCCPAAAPPPVSPGQVAVTEAYRLDASPNPFREEVAIRFYLPQSGPATLEVYNLSGQRVRRLESASFDAGRHDRVWDGRADGGQSLAPGVYLLRLQTQGQAVVKKLTLVR